jgi:hypothetical protein
MGVTMGDIDEQPRSFQLGRGRSDLVILFLALIFGVVLIAAPEAGQWIMRAILVTAEVLLIFCIWWVRQLRGIVAWRSSLRSPLGALVGLAVLGFWIWSLARGFSAGKWVDASITAVVLAEFAYLEWFVAIRSPIERSVRRPG